MTRAHTEPSSKTVRRFVLPALRPYQQDLVRDDARDVLCVSATQVGKTFALACWLLARMWEYRGPHVWWWIAPTYKQATAGMALMDAIGGSAGIIRSGPLKTAPYPIELINGTTCEFRTWDDPQNLMGTTIAGGVVDEAGLLTPQAQSAISSRRSETLGPLRYIGNPGLVSGPFRRLCSMAEKQTNVIEHQDARRRYGFHRWSWEDKLAALGEAQAADEYREFIDNEKQSIPEYEFRRLYEAEWTEDEAAVFRGVDRVTKGRHLLGPTGDRFVVGVDVGQVSDYTAAVSIGLRSRRIELREHFRGVSMPQAAVRLKALQDTLSAPIVLEINNQGAALAQEFDRLSVNYIPFTTTAQSKQEIILALAADVQGSRCELQDLEPMPYEFAIFRYLRMPSGLYRYMAPEGEHDDTVMAAALARWGVSHAVGRPRVSRATDVNDLGVMTERF